MTISDIRTERSGSEATVVATVRWEESDREPLELFFGIANTSESLTPAPEGFLTACAVPAMYHAERRILIEGSVCPEFHSGLHTALKILKSWYGGTEPTIEATRGFRCLRPAAPRTASLLSGGIDSMATLRCNMLSYPADHPARITDCVFIYGFDIGGFNADPDRKRFQHATDSLTEPAEEAGARILPAYTNLLQLERDGGFWVHQFSGAAMVAVGHFMTAHISRLHIASSYDIAHLTPWGSHPLLDPCYSSSALDIRHDGHRLSRLDKTRIVADWPAGLRNLRVCGKAGATALNCGRCEKCVMTMLQLEAIGRLDGDAPFPIEAPFAVELLRTAPISSAYRCACYVDTIELLRKRGRDDLATEVERMAARFSRETRKLRRWQQETDWKGYVKRIDRRMLGGRLAKAVAKNRARSRPPSPA